MKSNMTPCPLCTSTTARPWLHVPIDWRKSADKTAYELAWCDGCAFGFLAPRPTAAQVATFYDTPDYYTHATQAAKAPASPLHEKLRVALAWRLDKGRELHHTPAIVSAAWDKADLRGARVLDLGCGSGNFLARMQQQGAIVTGVEPDEKAREAVRSRGIAVHAGTAEDVPAEVLREKFDIIATRHVLEHCIDPLTVLRNIKSMLAPGGVYLCDVPNNNALGLQRAGAAWHWLDVPRHINFFTRQSLANAARKAGLTIASETYCGFTQQVAPAWIGFERTSTKHMAEAAMKNVRPDGLMPGHTQAWKLLAALALASDDERYDTLRIIAK
ncbi:methyltransferase [Phycisphaerae bacterium]|nr:methyltransferase [Phycisphaerae bacterium]